MPSQRDIVLIPIPFTDLSSQKRRPVIIVSNDEYNRTKVDIVVVALTSTPVTNPYSFSIDSPDLDNGSLRRTSTVRVDKLYTLAQSLIVATFGRVRPLVLDRIRALTADLTSAKP